MEEMIEEDQLDRQLRETAPYIDDDGFTARVVSKLPSPGRAPRSMRGIILVGITAVGSAIAYAISGGRFVNEAIMRLSTFPIWILLVFAFGWESTVLLIPGYLKRLSVAYYLQALVPHAMPQDSTLNVLLQAFQDQPSVPASLIYLSVIIGAALWLAGRAVEDREYVLEQ